MTRGEMKESSSTWGLTNDRDEMQKRWLSIVEGYEKGKLPFTAIATRGQQLAELVDITGEQILRREMRWRQEHKEHINKLRSEMAQMHTQIEVLTKKYKDPSDLYGRPDYLYHCNEELHAELREAMATHNDLENELEAKDVLIVELRRVIETAQDNQETRATATQHPHPNAPM